LEGVDLVHLEPESCKFQILFEPKEDALESYGLLSHETMASVSEVGCIFVAVPNCDGVSVHIEEDIDVGVIRCFEALGPKLNRSVTSDGAREEEVSGDEDCISEEKQSDTKAGNANGATQELSNNETLASVCVLEY